MYSVTNRHLKRRFDSNAIMFALIKTIISRKKMVEMYMIGFIIYRDEVYACIYI
jgi:hypothetical protein